MFEQTNQTEAAYTAAQDSLEAAFESGMASAAGEEASVQTEHEAPTNTEQAPTPETYTVKYNGKEVALTLDELKTRAQMGMNYDHVKAENDRIKNSQLYQQMRRMAQAEGVHFDELGAHLEKKTREKRMETLLASGMQKEAAVQYLDMEARLAKREKDTAELSPYLAFVRRYPNVRAEDISSAVWDKFRESGDLLGAYAEAENEQLRAQISALKQNQKNAETQIGSLANDRPHAPSDAFLEGLLGG